MVNEQIFIDVNVSQASILENVLHWEIFKYW